METEKYTSINVCGCLLKDNKILLRQKKLSKDKVIYLLPGTTLDLDGQETLDQTIIKLFLNDTKMIVKIKGLSGLREMIDNDGNYNLFFIFSLDYLSGELNENCNYKFYNFTDIHNLNLNSLSNKIIERFINEETNEIKIDEFTPIDKELFYKYNLYL